MNEQADASAGRDAYWTGVDVEELKRLCQEEGNHAACLELDRRGVPPPLLETGPEPVA